MNDHLDSSEIRRPDPTIGTPEQDGNDFPGQQGYPDTCAIRCQEAIIKQFTGTDPGEAALVLEADSHGWYTPGGGTPITDIGNLLELHGIPVNRYVEADVFHLASELGQGHKVIIGVDADDLWRENPIMERIQQLVGVDGANHAVLVTGIDTTDPSDVQVILSDPGSGEAAASYPMVQFLDAWKDSDFFMVATEQTAPAWLPEMANFDYGLGHIPFLGGLDFDRVTELVDQSESWDSWFAPSPGDTDGWTGGPIDALAPPLLPRPPDLFAPDGHDPSRAPDHDTGPDDPGGVSFGGYYNADDSYHYTSNDSDYESDTDEDT
ncbi:MAG: hypothetical protein ABFC89_01270 [Methanospirillum sp.]